MSQPRKTRQQRREDARQLAKEIIRSDKAKPKRWLDSGWYLAACMGIGVALVGPKMGKNLTVLLLIGMVACTFRPIWESRWVQSAAQDVTKRWNFGGLLALVAIGAVALGAYVWPTVRRHRLERSEWPGFEAPLKAQTDPHEEIGLLCPSNDESTCAYAQQFVDIFHDAGWNVKGNKVERVIIEKPMMGVSVFKKGTGKADPNAWPPQGLWATLSPSFFSVCQAFENIGVEPDSGANPSLSDAAIAIYFGPEKENPMEATTASYWMTLYKKGQMPGQTQ